MSKLLTLTIVSLLVVACTTAEPPTPPQTGTVEAKNLPVSTIIPPASPQELKLSAPEVATEKISTPTPMATVAPSPTSPPPPPPEPPSEAEALKLMYPDEDASPYKVILSAPFRQEGYDKHLVLTDNTLVNHCPACPVYVEAALFVYHNDVWQLEKLHQVAAEFSTGLDNSPTAMVIPFGPDKDGLVFGGGYQGQGYLISTDTYVTDVNGRFRQVLSLTTSESNRLNEACFEQQLCYEYGATVDLIRGDQPTYFDMRVATSGTKLVDDQLVEFTEVATYTFSGEVYTLAEKKETISPTPTTTAPPTILGLAGPDISYGGISFTIDPALGDRVFVDKTLDSIGCTNFSFASEGFCRKVGCVIVCPVESYRAEILSGDDIIEGLQSAIERQSNDYFPVLMAHILLRAQTQHLGFQNGAGIRAIVMNGQDLVLANNESVEYEFHGLSDDGQYYAMVIFPIEAPILLSTYDPAENTNKAAIPAPQLPDDEMQIGVVMREYNQEAQRQLDLLAGYSFMPDLELLDALVDSLLLTPPTSSTEPSTPATPGAGFLEADINYSGHWYREAFGYTRRAKNIKHFVLAMPESEVPRATAAEVFTSILFPSSPNVLLMREGRKEFSWALEYLYEAPEGHFSGQFEPGTYYVAAAFIAAPLSKEEAGLSDDVILYPGVTGGGASTDYFKITIEAEKNRPLKFTLTDENGWACTWLYAHNGRNFERRTEILRNVRRQENEQTETSNIGPVKIIDHTIIFRITEEKEEVSFIDEFYIILDGQKLHPEMDAHFVTRVAEQDQNYLTIKQGESFEFRFKIPRSFAGREQGNISVVVSGFYAPIEAHIRKSY